MISGPHWHGQFPADDHNAPSRDRGAVSPESGPTTTGNEDQAPATCPSRRYKVRILKPPRGVGVRITEGEVK